MPSAPATFQPSEQSRHDREHERKREFDRYREHSTARGYGWRWRKARATFLRGHALCVECDRDGIVMPATRVDHITPHKGDQVLFWDKTNWQPLCESHHNAKTAREDSNFARQGPKN